MSMHRVQSDSDIDWKIAELWFRIHPGLVVLNAQIPLWVNWVQCSCASGSGAMDCRLSIEVTLVVPYIFKVGRG